MFWHLTITRAKYCLSTQETRSQSFMHCMIVCRHWGNTSSIVALSVYRNRWREVLLACHSSVVWGRETFSRDIQDRSQELKSSEWIALTSEGARVHAGDAVGAGEEGDFRSFWDLSSALCDFLVISVTWPQFLSSLKSLRQLIHIEFLWNSGYHFVGSDKTVNLSPLSSVREKDYLVYVGQPSLPDFM